MRFFSSILLDKLSSKSQASSSGLELMMPGLSSTCDEKKKFKKRRYLGLEIVEKRTRISIRNRKIKLIELIS